jgi:acetyl-CoA C-acetyltransferase
MSKVGIISWAQTEFKERREDVHRGELVYQVSKEVLEKAKIDIKDVDSVISASCDTVDGISISNAFVAEAMGAFMKEESKVEQDGIYALMYAYHRLLIGHWRTALVVAHGKTSDAGEAFYSNMSCDPFLLRPLGLEQISAAALQAQVYCDKYKVSEKDAAKVVIKNRKNGALNKYAQLKSPVTLDEVMNSPYLASPIKKLDSPAYSDGAAAVLLATEEFAKSVCKNPVWIEGVGFYQDVYYPGYKDLSKSISCQLAAKKAYSEAGIKEPLKEIDFAEISENFSFYELMLYENLFLCKEGEGKKLIQDGITEIDGKFPVNPSGGTLCANSIMVAGLVRIIEAVRQLTNSADAHQLKKDLKKALVHGTDGLFLQSNIVFVLGV